MCIGGRKREADSFFVMEGSDDDNDEHSNHFPVVSIDVMKVQESPKPTVNLEPVPLNL